VSNNEKCCCGCSQDDERLDKARNVIQKYKTVKGGLISVLHDIQEIYGYLPEDVLHEVSEVLNTPMTEIYGVATFYNLFSLKAKGQHIIRVCLGTACYVKGSKGIVDRLSQELNLKIGETSADGKFTLEATRCLGACGLAPVMTIDDKVYARVSPDDIRKILDEYTDADDETAAAKNCAGGDRI
jgi:NADH:ubiquinone oxidoreductase subunit E